MNLKDIPATRIKKIKTSIHAVSDMTLRYMRLQDVVTSNSARPQRQHPLFRNEPLESPRRFQSLFDYSSVLVYHPYLGTYPESHAWPSSLLGKQELPVLLHSFSQVPDSRVHHKHTGETGWDKPSGSHCLAGPLLPPAFQLPNVCTQTVVVRRGQGRNCQEKPKASGPIWTWYTSKPTCVSSDLWPKVRGTGYMIGADDSRGLSAKWAKLTICKSLSSTSSRRFLSILLESLRDEADPSRKSPSVFPAWRPRIKDTVTHDRHEKPTAKRLPLHRYFPCHPEDKVDATPCRLDSYHALLKPLHQRPKSSMLATTVMLRQW